MKKFFSKINTTLLREAFFCMLFAFLVLGIVTLIGINLSFFSPFKNAFKDFSYLDLYYSEKFGDEVDTVNKNIVLVNINRLNRKEIAIVLNKILEENPKVVGLDLIFKNLENPVWDRLLSEQLTNKKIVSTYVIGDRNITASNRHIIGNKIPKGYSNFSFDLQTNVVRNFQGIKKERDTIFNSFGTIVAKKFMGANWSSDLNELLSTARPINYSGNRDNFLILEYQDIISQTRIPLLKDKIVLVGYLGSPNNHRFEIEDKHFTPMNEKYVGKSPPDTFGVVIHANIVQMLIENNLVKVIPTWFIIGTTIILTFLALCYFIWLNKQQLASYILRLNFMQLLFIILFVWTSLALFKRGILFKTASITAVMVFSVGLIGFYKKLAHFFYKKFKWEGYFFRE